MSGVTIKLDTIEDLEKVVDTIDLKPYTDAVREENEDEYSITLAGETSIVKLVVENPDYTPPVGEFEMDVPDEDSERLVTMKEVHEMIRKVKIQASNDLSRQFNWFHKRMNKLEEQVNERKD